MSIDRKEEILNRIRSNTQDRYEMPSIDLDPIVFEDRVAQFSSVVELVGGAVVELQDGENINSIIERLYPDAKRIASALAEVEVANVNPNSVSTPHELNGVDLAVVSGAMGVAENGCVWCPQNIEQKATYFIAEYLMIIVDRQTIVNNMHEAYAKLSMNDYGFGVFISGPSKTADIEQALVVGAHGACGVTVVIK